MVLDAKLEERKSDNNIGDMTREELVTSSSLVHTSPKTNYTPSKSSRSSSIEQDETTIEIPHLEGEMVSNRKTHTPDKQTQDSNPALTVTETESDVKPDTKVFHSNGVDGDFMSRVSKGGRRLFIEEYPQTCSTANGGSLSGGTNGANPPQVSTRSTEEKNLNNEVRSKNGTEVYGNTVKHPTCVSQPPGGQNFFHEPVVL